jgi:hypothetical protein
MFDVKGGRVEVARLSTSRGWSRIACVYDSQVAWEANPDLLIAGRKVLGLTQTEPAVKMMQLAGA